MVDQGLRNVHDARLAQVAQAQRGQLGRQGVVALLAQLAQVAAAHHLGQQEMAGAARHLQVVGNRDQGRAVRVARQVFKNAEASFQGAA